MLQSDEQNRLTLCLHGVHCSASDQCYTMKRYVNIFLQIVINVKNKRTDILIAVYPQTGDLINKINYNSEKNIFKKPHPAYWQIDEH